jgi:hypothetical protein
LALNISMTFRLCANLFVRTHFFTGFSGAVLGGWGNERERKVFANVGDTQFSGAARGAIRGIQIPWKIVREVPTIWDQEFPRRKD